MVVVMAVAVPAAMLVIAMIMAAVVVPAVVMTAVIVAAVVLTLRRGLQAADVLVGARVPVDPDRGVVKRVEAVLREQFSIEHATVGIDWNSEADENICSLQPTTDRQDHSGHGHSEHNHDHDHSAPGHKH